MRPSSRRFKTRRSSTSAAAREPKRSNGATRRAPVIGLDIREEWLTAARARADAAGVCGSLRVQEQLPMNRPTSSFRSTPSSTSRIRRDPANHGPISRSRRQGGRVVRPALVSPGRRSPVLRVPMGAPVVRGESAAQVAADVPPEPVCAHDYRMWFEQDDAAPLPAHRRGQPVYFEHFEARPIRGYRILSAPVVREFGHLSSTAGWRSGEPPPKLTRPLPFNRPGPAPVRRRGRCVVAPQLPSPSRHRLSGSPPRQTRIVG